MAGVCKVEAWRFVASVMTSLAMSLLGLALAATFRGVSEWHMQRSMASMSAAGSFGDSPVAAGRAGVGVRRTVVAVLPGGPQFGVHLPGCLRQRVSGFEQ